MAFWSSLSLSMNTSLTSVKSKGWEFTAHSQIHVPSHQKSHNHLFVMSVLWTSLAKDIWENVSASSVCAQNKSSNSTPAGLLKPFPHLVALHPGFHNWPPSILRSSLWALFRTMDPDSPHVCGSKSVFAQVSPSNDFHRLMEKLIKPTRSWRLLYSVFHNPTNQPGALSWLGLNMHATPWHHQQLECSWLNPANLHSFHY